MAPTGHTKTRLQNSTTNRRRRPPRSGPHVDRADARTRKRTRNSPPVEDAEIFHLQLDLHTMTLTLHPRPLSFPLHGPCGSLRCVTSRRALALNIGSPMPSSDIASFSMSTLDRVFGSPSVGGFTSPIPAPLLRNVIVTAIAALRDLT